MVKCRKLPFNSLFRLVTFEAQFWCENDVMEYEVKLSQRRYRNDQEASEDSDDEGNGRFGPGEWNADDEIDIDIIY